MNGRSDRYRLHHWQLAERQRYLKELESLEERMRADVDSLNAEIEAAGGVPAAAAQAPLDPNFIRPLVERRDKMLGSIAEVASQLAEAREAVVEAQQEMKLVEGAAAPAGFKFEDRLTRRARREM